MDQVRQNTLIKWNRAVSTLSLVPENSRQKVVKGLSGCFTHRDNPHRNNGPNEHFQRKLDELIQGDVEYYRHPTVPRLCDMVAKLIHKWEQIYQQYIAHSGKHPRHQKSSETNKHAKATDNDVELQCQACKRYGHRRDPRPSKL